MATGQPPAGFGPAGRQSVKEIVLLAWTGGVSASVPTGGMYSPGCTMVLWANVYLPYAMVPTAPGHDIERRQVQQL